MFLLCGYKMETELLYSPWSPCVTTVGLMRIRRWAKRKFNPLSLSHSLSLSSSTFWEICVRAMFALGSEFSLAVYGCMEIEWDRTEQKIE